MSVEDEMRLELRRIEREISILDEELEKLHGKILQILMVRKKKEHDLKVLRSNFGENSFEGGDIQTTLARLLKERA